MTRARPSPRLLALSLVLAVAALAAGCEARRLAPDAVAACERCHGGDGSAAPPRSVRGLTETSARAVGAHRQHLSDGRIRRAVDCAECHVVPSRVEGHFGDAAATVTWSGPLARARGATPRWDPETERCSNVYCHGAVSGGGDAKSPRWTLVDGSQKGCGSCHGYPPPSHGPSSTACHLCHADTVLGDDTTIDVAGGKHVNGAIDVPGASCGACHPVPPDTGAHRVHANPMSAADAAYGSLALLEDVRPAGGTSYEFGCGHCHPLDPAQHLAHVASAPGAPRVPDVFLDPAGAPAGSLRARNAPDARYDPATGTCSGVYCHSSGQESPAFVTSPPWTAAPGSLGCAGCHGNPPRYASGGAGAADANSHLVLADDGWESGHFQGMPGYWHTSKHGGNWSPANDAAPITCQTCHAETVDPAAIGPSGFYWLDTTGDYQLPGGDLPPGDAFYERLQCTACHDGSHRRHRNREGCARSAT